MPSLKVKRICPKCNGLDTRDKKRRVCTRCEADWPLPNKMGAKKTVCTHDHRHDSKREAERCDELHLLQQGGDVSCLVVHQRFPLQGHRMHDRGGAYPEDEGKGFSVGFYEADFCYWMRVKAGQTLMTWVVEDVKGVKTDLYQLKKKLMKACHGIEITETH